MAEKKIKDEVMNLKDFTNATQPRQMLIAIYQILLMIYENTKKEK